MSEFLEVLSPKALSDLQALNSELVKTVANVKTVNENMIGIKTPSGSDSAIKKLNENYDAQAGKIAKLQIELEKYAQAQNRTIISNNNVIKSNITTEASIKRKNDALDKEISKLNEQSLINGACNITGGGLIENIPRVLPGNVTAKIDLSKIKVNKIFSWIKNNGVAEKEMLRTFNCGVGFVLFAKKNNFKKIINVFSGSFKPYVIGEIIKKSHSKIQFIGNVKF